MNTAPDTEDMFKNTTVTEIVHDGIKKEYRITLDKAEVETAVDSQLARMQATANLPGFRKGKVPIDVLRQREGSRIRDQVTARATARVSEDHIKKGGLAVRTPQLVPVSEGDELSYTLTFEKMPEMPDLDFNTMELIRYKVDSEKHREEMIDFIVRLVDPKKSDAIESATDGYESAEGDCLHFIGTRSSKSHRQSLVVAQPVTAGEDVCFPESVNTIGMKRGDTLSFEQEGFAAGFPGKDDTAELFTYELTVDAISSRPEWGALFRQIGDMKADEAASARDSFHKMAIGHFDDICERMLVQQVRNTVIENCDFALPAEFRADSMASILRQRSDEIRRQNEALQKMSPEGSDGLPDPDAVTMSDMEIDRIDNEMRYHLYETAYLDQHNLHPTRKDLDAFVDESGKDMTEEDRSTAFMHLRRRNFFDHIMKRFLIREKFVSLDELLYRMGIPAAEKNLDYWNWLPIEENGKTNEHPDTDS